MPNHVSNRCTVTGPEDEVARFRATCFTPDGDGDPILDFNTVIPMPEILRTIEDSSRYEMGFELLIYRAERGAPFAEYGSNFVNHYKDMRSKFGMEREPMHRVAARKLEEDPELETVGKLRMRAILETGYTSWYPWSAEHWGTKWNAYFFAFKSETPLEFTFQTAWSFPEPVFVKLAEQYPTLTFDCVCHDEGDNFAGIGLFGAGADQNPFKRISGASGANLDEYYVLAHGRPRPVDDDEDDA